MNNLISEKLEAYIAAHSTPESAHLAALNRETYLKVLMPQMLSGHVQGKFLEFISRMIRPERILEIGTFTGYSGICLAKGLRPGGKIITIDMNEELTPMVEKYIALEKVENLFDIRIGNAIEIIPKLNESFDLVFIDADKINWKDSLFIDGEHLSATGAKAFTEYCFDQLDSLDLPPLESSLGSID